MGFRERGNSGVTSGLLWVHVGWQSCIPAEQGLQALRFAYASKAWLDAEIRILLQW